MQLTPKKFQLNKKTHFTEDQTNTESVTCSRPQIHRAGGIRLGPKMSDFRACAFSHHTAPTAHSTASRHLVHTHPSKHGSFCSPGHCCWALPAQALRFPPDRLPAPFHTTSTA